MGGVGGVSFLVVEIGVFLSVFSVILLPVSFSPSTRPVGSGFWLVLKCVYRKGWSKSQG